MKRLFGGVVIFAIDQVLLILQQALLRLPSSRKGKGTPAGYSV